MKKALKWLDINFEPLCMSVTFYLMAGLITLQVILRFVFKSGFAWGEEIARFIFVWLVFLAIPYAARNDRHIGIEFVRNMFPVPVRKVIMILANLSALLLFGVLLSGAVDVVRHAAQFGDKAQSLSISMNWMHCAPVAGYGLMLVRTLQNTIWKLTHFGSSFELFQNPNGRYSGSSKIFFLPAYQREQEEALMLPEALEEQQARKQRKEGNAS